MGLIFRQALAYPFDLNLQSQCFIAADITSIMKPKDFLRLEGYLQQLLNSKLDP